MRSRLELSPDGQVGSSAPAPAGVPAGAGAGSGAAAAQPVNKIQAFESRIGAKRHEEVWKRTPNVTGSGAIHMRTFHCKLGDDAIGYLDQQINEWLDAHPQYEVKFVTSNIGEWSGKLGKEHHLVVLVWV